MDRIGQSLGNYIIQKALGRGRFGQVYLGQHTFLPRQVAIKVPGFPLDDPDEREMFLREAHFLDRLSHPHILRLFDAGFDGETPYLIMEYVSGGTLKDRIRGAHGRLPFAESLTILSQIGQALHYAHQQGIVHRDLKPANILFDGDGRPLLADFGIAVLFQTLSRTQNVDGAGTPAYMAPEQFVRQASIHSDQYALAVIAYELFTGRRPFVADSPAAYGYKHMTEAPIPPRRLNPDLPASMEQAILTALAKEDTHRFSDVAAFVSALQPPRRLVLASPPSQPLDPGEQTTPTGSDLSYLDRLREQGRRLFSSGRYRDAVQIFAQVTQNDPQDATSIALLGASLVADAQAVEGVQILGQALALGHEGAFTYAFLAQGLTALEQYEEAKFVIEEGLRTDPHYSSLYQIKGEVLEALGDVDGAKLAYYQAISIQQDAVRAYQLLAFLLLQQEADQEALPVLERLQTLTPQDSWVHQARGMVLARLGEHEEALAAFSQAITLNPAHAALHQQRGDELLALGYLIEAHSTYEQAVRLDPQNAEYRLSCGNTYYQLGYYEKALEAYRAAVELDPTLAIGWYNLSVLYTHFDQTRLARQALKKAQRLGYFSPS